jgi:hypothetical protein
VTPLTSWRRRALRTIPVEQLREVETRLRALGARAEDAQLYTAMIEWMNFTARWRLGAIKHAPRAARLDDRWALKPGVIEVVCLIDQDRPGTGPVKIHDARARIDAGVWSAIKHVARKTPLARLPVNQIYHFYAGTSFPGTSYIQFRVLAEAGASSRLEAYSADTRRALAACALDLAFSPALDGAIRHGAAAPHDEGVVLARQLARVPIRQVTAARRRLLDAARAPPVSAVRSDT